MIRNYIYQISQMIEERNVGYDKGFAVVKDSLIDNYR